MGLVGPNGSNSEYLNTQQTGGEGGLKITRDQKRPNSKNNYSNEIRITNLTNANVNINDPLLFYPNPLNHFHPKHSCSKGYISASECC